MKCQVCHADTPTGATFCQQCGAKLSTFNPANIETAAAPGTVSRPLSPEADDAMRAPRRGAADVAEETLWEGSFSPRAMFGTAVGAGILSILLLVLAFAFAAGIWFWLLLSVILLVWLAVGARLVIRRLGIHYKLTNQMFYHQRGVLTRVTDRIELIEIHDVTWEQGLLDRVVNVGRIKVASNDRTDPVFFLQGIENVEAIAGMIDKARRAEQVRRGRRIDFSHIDGQT